jgi:hypothetical protein
MNYIEENFNRAIHHLEDAIKVCLEAPEIEDQGYPYAAGYARAVMMGTVDDLNRILNQLREENRLQ